MERVESTVGWQHPPLTEIQARFDLNKESYITQLLEGTRGWFSKPLTAQWLRSKSNVRVAFPPGTPPPLAPNRSGTIQWKMMKLEITKDAFTLCWSVGEVLPDPVIELEEEEPAGPPPAGLGGGQDSLLELTGGDRKAQKERVLAARRRAARALYKAERLIQEYCAIWGEDTDWEDEDSDGADS